MVEFDTSRSEIGICRLIKSNNRGIIIDLVNRTSEEGKEFGIVVIQTKSNDLIHLVASSPTPGTEKTFDGKAKTEAKMKAFKVMSDMRINNNDADLHFFHTHPNGIPDMSLGDLVSIPHTLDGPTPLISQIVVAEIEDGVIALNGLQLVRDIEDIDIESLKSRASSIKEMVRRQGLSYNRAKDELFDIYGEYFLPCSTIIEV